MDASQVPQAWREWWEERAAIMQYEGGLSREAAEDAAWQCLTTMVQQREDARQTRNESRRHAAS